MEQIGIKSTRLRSVTGEQIIMSNSDILKSRVRNYGLASGAARGAAASQ